MDERLATNRANWNERTPVHAASEFYDVEGFKKGRITLTDIERREVGDVSGKTLLHLQCHFGMDTMSWSRLGAKATGVDISDTAIDLARSLNHEIGADARFICSNVYDLPDVLDEEFDIVFTSLGVLCWLPDLDRWASVVHRFLRPGGTFYILDGHPVKGIFEESEEGEIRLTHDYSYFHDEFFFEGNDHTYAGSEIIASPVYEWQHSLGEIVTALATSGLTIEFLHEFPVCAYHAFPSMQKDDDGWWRLPEHNDIIPKLFSIKATK
ncbi:MAG: class I SAM-dependent methyltransferase [Dehalococcoidia bacterium]|nr:class I SAM-dependent methyltransferase [Dehalococcoidia bacterium]